MEKLIKSKNELLLGTIGVLFVAFLIYVFIWGISFLADNIGTAISSEKGTTASMNFDLQGAERLNLKGLGH